MYKEQTRMLALASRIAAKLGRQWMAEPYPVGSQVVGPDRAKITIEAISEDALQIICKPVNAMDVTLTFTAPLAWGSDKIIDVLVRDYVPMYRNLLADRMEHQHGAEEWAEDTKDALAQIGEILSITPRVNTEGHDGEPNHIYGYFDVGEAGEVAIEAAHRGDINVRLKTRDINVLRVLIPVLATYNKPAARGALAEVAELQKEVAWATSSS